MLLETRSVYRPEYKTRVPLCSPVQRFGRLSEGSKRETHLYELDIQVKGFSTLEESLVSTELLQSRRHAVIEDRSQKAQLRRSHKGPRLVLDTLKNLDDHRSAIFLPHFYLQEVQGAESLSGAINTFAVTAKQKQMLPDSFV